MSYLNNLKNGLLETQAYKMQLEILSGKIDEQKLLEIFEVMSKREIGIVTKDELKGFVLASREKMNRIITDKKILDTCGTGGSGLNTFNISTISSFVCATAGINIAKHGNKAVTGKCGSADILNAVGIDFDISSEEALKLLEKTNWVFLFAPLYHSSFKNAGIVRKKFGKKTYFNFLGPLLNPMESKYQIVGVSDIKYAEIIGEVLIETGSEKVAIVCGNDGLDEITLTDATTVFEFSKNEKSVKYQINPEDFGFEKVSFEEIKGGDVSYNLEILQNLSKGFGTKAQKEIVALNVGMAMYIVGYVKNLRNGVEKALEIINSGKVENKIKEILDSGK